jgi:hypothetical protein
MAELYFYQLMINPVNYRDRALILSVVPFISALNYYLTYTQIKWGWFLVITFVLDTLEGYVAWYAGRWAILRFDRWLPWEKHLTYRLVVQVPVVSIIIIGVIVLQTELVNFIARGKPLPLLFYTQAVFIFLIWAIFINFLYLALYFLRRYQEGKRAPMPPPDETALVVKTGRSQRRIAFDSVSLFYMSNELVYGITADGKIPLPGYTLDRIEKMATTHGFFRANRQYLITRSMVHRVVKDDNGKLALFLTDAPNLPIMISRLRAPAFKKWLQPDS